MSKEVKYYLIFNSTLFHNKTKKSLNGYWAEIIMDENYFAKIDKIDILYALRKYYDIGDYMQENQIHDENRFSRLRKLNRNPLKGCYEKIYMPLPDNIHFDYNDPFLSSKKLKPHPVYEKHQFKTKFEKILHHKKVSIIDIAKATGINLSILSDIRDKNRTRKYTSRIYIAIATYLKIHVTDII